MSVIAPEQGTRVNHREAGSGQAVVCLHASASSSAQWRPLMDRLADRLRTLAADLVEVSGAGHMAPLTHPERINALITRFLDLAKT